MIRLKSQLNFFHALKDAKSQAIRALQASASDDLIKASVECAINTQNGKHKLTKYEKSKLQKCENWLLASVNPRINFRSKRKLNSKLKVYNYTAHNCFVRRNSSTNK